VSNERNTLKAVYDLKNTKYERLAQELRRFRHEPVTVTVVIVSSMGAVYAPSLNLLRKVLKCNDRETRKLGKQLSDAALAGSLRIWFEIMRKREQGVTFGEEGDALVAQESEAANAPEGVNDGGKEDEEDEAEREDEHERREERWRQQEAVEEEGSANGPEDEGNQRERQVTGVVEDGRVQGIERRDQHDGREAVVDEGNRGTGEELDPRVGTSEDPGSDEGDDGFSC
jgi:hypothetical protein